MYLRREFFLGVTLLAVGALAACSPGSSAGFPGSITPTPPPLSVNLVGPLQAVGQTAILQVSQGGYIGPFTIISSNGAVLSLAQKLQTTQRSPAATGSQTILSPNGQAYVSALAQGSASISVSGYGGIVSSPTQLQNIAIGSPSPSPSPSPPPPNVLSVNPSSVAVNGTGAASAASILVQETGYTGAFTESDTCSGIASVTPSAGTGPSFTFTAEGVVAGTCTASFTDASAQRVSTTIVVTTNGIIIQSDSARARPSLPI